VSVAAVVAEVAPGALVGLAAGAVTGRTRLGALRVVEVPGAVWIMLAGRPYRRQMMAVLGARQARAEHAVI
jgi:hypothetical protein